MNLLSLVEIGFITFFFSFGVQTLGYLFYKYIDHELIKCHKCVIHYTSGIIGDSILVPLTNVFCALTIYSLGKTIYEFSLWPYSFFSGVVITFFFHYFQLKLKLTNWTMPEVGHWNLLGVYHAVFMSFESSFLSYTLLVIIKTTLEQGIVFVLDSPVKYSFLILGLFLITFLFDYRKPLKLVR